MSGSGVVDVVDNVSDKDGAPVWRLIIQDGPGNAGARKEIETNQTVATMFPPHVAVDMLQKKYPTCPIVAGMTIAWDARHINAAGAIYDKHGFEYDPNAPLSPP